MTKRNRTPVKPKKQTGHTATKMGRTAKRQSASTAAKGAAKTGTAHKPPVEPVETKTRNQPAKKEPPRPATAEDMGRRQREISVAEFFTKNRHLLGFDNPRKALLTTIKEGVDNSLDACEEAGILPDIKVMIAPGTAEDRFRVAIEDNGPGIVKAQIPRIFAKLLYGSKFHRLKMSRGQQGIGISAAGMYGQLTTGKPIVIISKTPSRRSSNPPSIHKNKFGSLE